MRKSSAHGRKSYLKLFLKVSLWVSGIAMLTGLVLLCVTALSAPELNDRDVMPSGYLTTVVDQDDQPVLSLADSESNRVAVDISQVPEVVRNAFVAIEDSRFYTHHGIDFKGIARAVFRGVANGFKFREGASTITQQLLKNNVFTEWMNEETMADKLQRKIQEQYLAVRLEATHDKDWILINYLNSINLGGGTRGIQVASRYYFGKDVWNLTAAEAAMLAAIPKSPTKYNPFNNPEESKERQELVLAAMRDQGYLTEEAYQEAMQEDVLGHLDVNHEIQGAETFNWFMDSLLRTVVEDLMKTYGYQEEDAWNQIYSGGLTIHSTQNTKLQNIVEQVLADPGWFADEEQQASIVMLDNKTGAVAAIAGARGEKTASLVYNRATDSIRQPGSTIKIIGEYAAGMNRDELTLGTTLDDAPYTYTDGTEIHNSYESYTGMMTIRKAIAESSNIVALQAYQKVGQDNVFRYLQNFGITTLDEQDICEALSIGGTYHGVSNLEMASAYHAIADQGQYIRAYYYTTITDHDGRIILEHKTDDEKREVISSDTAALLTKAMEEVIETGTGQPCKIEGRSLAGKSGTTNDVRDAWFIGYSSYYTLSAWGGYDDNRSQEDSLYIKQIWRAIMELSHDGLENQDLGVDINLLPVTICTKCGNRSVPNLCSATQQGDMTRIEWYKQGTEPEADCTCHEAVTICTLSGKPANTRCPSAYTVNRVYLKSASAGTEDSYFVRPAELTGSCEVHKASWWSNIFSPTPSPEPQQEEEKEEENLFETPDHSSNGNGNGHNSWKDFFKDIFW